LSTNVGVSWLLPSCNIIIISNIGLELTTGSEYTRPTAAGSPLIEI